WSGLSSRNTERSLPNEGPSPNDSSKQQLVWADNNLQSAPNINLRPLIRQDDLSRPNSTVNYSGLPGFHQPGADTAQEPHNRLHSNSSQRSIPQILERGKWLDCSPQQKPVAEGSHNYGNAANSPGLEINEKVISGSWNHQQTLSSPNRSSEPFNRSNGWNYMKSAPPDNNTTPTTRENINVFQPHRDMGQVPTSWEPDSDSSVASEHEKSA
ncbi:putative dentin sialophosphoprotein-like, partial [Trifolium medium]|nr:putative dentin sialophosphoprotein-like [Trifolium medium]